MRTNITNQAIYSCPKEDMELRKGKVEEGIHLQD